MNNTNLPLAPSEIWWIIGQIFAVDREGALFNTLVGMNKDCKIGFQKRETSLSRMVEAFFSILDRLGMTHECDGRTDGQT